MFMCLYLSHHSIQIVLLSLEGIRRIPFTSICISVGELGSNKTRPTTTHLPSGTKYELDLGILCIQEKVITTSVKRSSIDFRLFHNQGSLKVSDMSKISGSGDKTSALIPYISSGETGQSADSISDQEYDFLDFLGVAQSLKIDFLPITWQPALDKVGEGGTAVIYQALINIQATFTFKRLKPPRSAMKESRNLRALIAEISILGHPAIRYHPNVANIEGICWDVVDGGEEVWPVLMLEKTRCGDLNRFMTSGPGKELDSKNRLDMLFDVALAVSDLHITGRFSIPS